jgi:hypothetical protein
MIGVVWQFLPTFRDNTSSHFQESSRPLKMQINILSRNFENNCQLILRNIKEERRPEAHRGGNLEAPFI